MKHSCVGEDLQRGVRHPDTRSQNGRETNACADRLACEAGNRGAQLVSAQNGLRAEVVWGAREEKTKGKAGRSDPVERGPSAKAPAY